MNMGLTSAASARKKIASQRSDSSSSTVEGSSSQTPLPTLTADEEIVSGRGAGNGGFGAMERIIGTVFGRAAVADDVRRNKPWKQASAVLAGFVLLNFFCWLFLFFSVYTVGGQVVQELATFFTTFAFVLFIFVLIGALLWFAFSFVVFGLTKLGEKKSDVSVAAAYCFTAFFYPFYFLLGLLAVLFGLILWSGLFMTGWYFFFLLILSLAFVILIAVCLYKFFKGCYSLSAGKSWLAVFAYFVGVFVLYLLVRFIINLLINAVTGGVGLDASAIEM